MPAAQGQQFGERQAGGVRQRSYGVLPACKAVGGLMHQADLGEQIDCRLLSFLDSLRILRDTVANTRNAATAPLPKFYQGKLKL